MLDDVVRLLSDAVDPGRDSADAGRDGIAEPGRDVRLLDGAVLLGGANAISAMRASRSRRVSIADKGSALRMRRRHVHGFATSAMHGVSCNGRFWRDLSARRAR